MIILMGVARIAPIMFSGIVEAHGLIINSQSRTSLDGNNLVQLQVQRPSDYTDLRAGDSIAINGMCLTLEAWDQESMTFTLAAESLRILEIVQPDPLVGLPVNLERSLRFGDRIHGHLVSGHVDARGQILEIQTTGGSWEMDIGFPKMMAPYIWKKGSVAVNGVSLTVNSVDKGKFRVCLIPETVKRTVFQFSKAGDAVNLEADWYAKAMFHWQGVHHEV